MPRSFLKNLNNTFLLIIVLFFFSCSIDRRVNANLPPKEALWARVIESQYSDWKRPIIKINPDAVPKTTKVKPNFRQPLPINQAQFIPISVAPFRKLEEPLAIQPKKIIKIKTRATPYYYTVKKGDALSSIAQRFYGKSQSWKKIYQANRNILKSPNNLKVGQKLLIP